MSKWEIQASLEGSQEKRDEIGKKDEIPLQIMLVFSIARKTSKHPIRKTVKTKFRYSHSFHARAEVNIYMILRIINPFVPNAPFLRKGALGTNGLRVKFNNFPISNS